MDCRIVQQNIDLFVDGKLSEDEHKQLLNHAASCASCGKALDDAVRLKSALSSLDEMEPPKGLVMSAIKNAKKKKPLFAYISVATAAVAAAIALVVVLTPGTNMDNATRMSDASAKFAVGEEAAPEEMAPAAPDSDARLMMDASSEVADGGVEDDLTSSAEGAALEAPVPAPSETIYASEEDFVLSEGGSYFKPVALPKDAALESIAVDELSIVFTYRLDNQDAFVFEWLDALDSNGLKDWLEQKYGDLSELTFDNAYYIAAGDTVSDVYWEQDGDAFHAVVPAGFTSEDIAAYCQAQFVQVPETQQ